MSNRQTSIYMGLLIFLFNLFSGNLQAENIAFSEFPDHKFYIPQTTAATSLDNYDVLFYDINLKIKHTDADKIKGTVGIEARILEANVNEIQINLDDNMTVDSVFNELGLLAFEHTDDLITVTLDKPYSNNEKISLTVAYRGFPDMCGLQGFNIENNELTKNQLVISTLSQSECARSWWPCKDQVNDKADSFDIAIQVDKEFYCVSNGKLNSIVDIGDTTRTFYYTVRHPMTTYNFALAISDYAIWEQNWIYNNGQDTMPIVHYVFRQHDFTNLKNKWKETARALTYLSDWFGLYPFADEKYGHVNYQAGYGMEHQTISFLPARTTAVFDTLIYVYHELAHQWWGNMITCKSWNDVWIQEGIATYAQALYFEHDEGWRAYHKHMNSMRCERTDRSIYLENGTDFDSLFEENVVYFKGAWVFHMLRRKLGDDLFRAGLHAFYNSEYKDSSISTDEFIEFFGKSVGVNLDKFFDQWVKKKGLPVYEWSYWQGPPDPNGDGYERNIYLYVEQVQDTDPEIFEMPVDFVFEYGNNLSDTVTLEVNSRINRYVVKVPDKLDTIKLDPMNWVLQKNTNTDWRMRIVTEYVPGIPEIALDTGVVGSEYEDRILTSNEDNSQIEFHQIEGNIPSGWVLDSDGLLHGYCLDVGNYNFTVSAVDKNDPKLFDTLSLTLTIMPLPENYNLYQNYPNPFNNETIIVFDLPRPGNTSIEIYNVLGQKVTTLIDGYYFAGNNYHISWQGRNDRGDNVSSGIYLYRLRSGDFTSTRKMLLLK
ncbi:MAG: M1 family aminopeptidase [bacterium]